MQTEGGVCKCSTLYNAAILSDLEIVEEYNLYHACNYIPLSRCKCSLWKDLNLKTIKIILYILGRKFWIIDYIGIYGREKSPEVVWNHSISNVVEAPKYYKKNTKLEKGEERILIKGLNGATVESHITIKYDDGNIKIKDLGISRYIPLPYIIEINE